MPRSRPAGCSRSPRPRRTNPSRVILDTVLGPAPRRRASPSSPATSSPRRSPIRRSTASRSTGWARRATDTVVIEDSRNGLLAATGAGLRCVVTVSSFTRGEDFTAAALVVSSLGDPGEPMEILANRSPAAPNGQVELRDLEAVLAGAGGSA